MSVLVWRCWTVPWLVAPLASIVFMVTIAFGIGGDSRLFLPHSSCSAVGSSQHVARFVVEAFDGGSAGSRCLTPVEVLGVMSLLVVGWFYFVWWASFS